MFLLGIDIAKLNHVASIVDEPIFSNFKFQNNILRFSSLLKKILMLYLVEYLKNDFHTYGIL